MIGQTNLLSTIEEQIAADKFARFNIICGPVGSGKKLLCKKISKLLACNTITLQDVKVETIRKMIDDAYTIKVKTLFIISDADNMSLAAKNSLLKVTEEPPNNAYFIMTLENVNNSLPTIKSRASVFNMEFYSMNELEKYLHSKTQELEGEQIILELCETPGDVDYLLSIDAIEFYDYVKKVFNNIATVSGANSFKIASTLSLKDGAEGYDLKMFLKAFKIICFRAYMESKNELYKNYLYTTIYALSKCSNKSINKTMLFDLWILKIRECYNGSE